MAAVFDKMVMGINRGINTVSENSKFLIEKAQINTAMQDVEKGKERTYRDLGELVYNLQTEGEIAIAQCKGICDEITGLNNKMRELQIQMQNLEAQKNVLRGYADSQTVDSNEYVLCDCGYNNKKDAKYCAKCGKQMKE